MIEEIFKKTSLTDVLIIVISSLAIVSFWRGVWGLMDVYLFPENPPLSLLISIALGLAMLFSIALYNPKK